MERYREAHRRSLADPEGYWSEKAKLVEWREPFTKALDYGRPPFAKWFVGGTTNLCHNAIDRHWRRAATSRAVYVSTETGRRGRPHSASSPPK